MKTLIAARPLSPFARVAFTLRGDCDVCGRIDVVCRKSDTLTPRMSWLIVCADCTMRGAS